jgi:hypothetical protein
VTEDDIVERIARIFMAEAAVPESVARTIDLRIRQEWGGCRPYIPKMQPREWRLDVPKTTFYRWMERRPPRR